MRNSHCTTYQYLKKAKKDYKTGFYNWFDLKRNYPQLTVKQIFKVILENRKNQAR